MAPLAPLKVFNQSFSCKAPLVVPIDLDFTSSNSFDVDLTQYIDQGYLDYVGMIYFDLSTASYDITLTSNICKQNVYLQHGKIGYLPIFLGDYPKFKAVVSTSISAVQQIFASNIPFYPFIQQVA